jgi:hypothetical protein
MGVLSELSGDPEVVYCSVFEVCQVSCQMHIFINN